MARDKGKPLQVRRTLLDVINAQIQLLRIIRLKKERNASLSYDDREPFLRIFFMSVMSYGSIPCRYTAPDGRIIDFGHLETLVHFLCKTTGSYVKITESVSNSEYTVPISELWSLLEKRVIHIFPTARREAIHISSEYTVREEATAHTFSLDEKID